MGEGIKWITGEVSRAEVHRLRSEFDAIVTGIGTVLADDPLLTVRLPELEHKSPVRVVLSRNQPLPPESKLAKTADEIPVWVLDAADIHAALQQLTEKGITRVLVEAGQKLNTAFLQSGRVDRIYWFKAPGEIGEGGLSAFQENDWPVLQSWQTIHSQAFGKDVLITLEPS